MASISQAAQADIAKQMDAATADQHKIPGAVFASVNRKGEPIFCHASGKRGADTDEKMTLDTTFWIASCTKMLCTLGCMQLVERGQLGLDDADQLEKLVPEIKDVKLLRGVSPDGKPNLAERKNRITLRMLLTHTAGFGYSFFNNDLRRHGYPAGFDEFTGDVADIVKQPVTNEPGSAWQYGVNIDWAGLALERVTGQTLNDYLQEHVFKPLGITEINMFPSADMRSRLAYMHQKTGAVLRTRDHLHRRALTAAASDDPKVRAAVFNSGGAGCFAKPTEYCKVLAALLNDGTSPTTGATILKPESVNTFLENQIPQFPNFARDAIPDAKPDLTNPITELYPQPPEQPQGWSLAGMVTIHPGATGRGANTVWWAGLANLFWYLDREKGVAGMIASQILPFGNPDVMGLWASVEAAIYQAVSNSP